MSSSSIIEQDTAEASALHRVLVHDLAQDGLARSVYGQSLSSAPALVLNADYRPLSYLPLSLWSWEDAIRAVVSRKAVPVAHYSNLVVRSVKMRIRCPSVIVLTQFHRVRPSSAIPVRRSFLYLRDDFTCQYCLKRCSLNELSLDHLVPKSRGGAIQWTNVVCSCKTCNQRKGKLNVQDLHRVGMRLHKTPYVPSMQEIFEKSRKYRPINLHPDWIEYL